MKNILKISTIALMMVSFSCSGMQLALGKKKESSYGRLIARKDIIQNSHGVKTAFDDLRDDTKDMLYDNYDNQTQRSYNCTSSYNNYHQKKRFLDGTGISIFKQAFLTQNPLIALDHPHCPEFIFKKEHSGSYKENYLVIDPRSESFYRPELIKEFKRRHPDKFLSMKTYDSSSGKNGNVLLCGGKQNLQKFTWIPSNILIMSIAERNLEALQQELTYQENQCLFSISRQKNNLEIARKFAEHTNNIPAIKEILKTEKKLMNQEEKVHFFNAVILDSAQASDNDSFKAYVDGGDYYEMTHPIIINLVSFGEKPAIERLLDLQKQGRCSQENIDYYLKKLQEKKPKSDQNKHCTIL